MSTTLARFFTKDTFFDELKPFLSSVPLFTGMKIRKLRNTYFNSDKVNSYSVPNSRQLIVRYDHLLDLFIKRYLFDYIEQPSESETCQEDNCWWDEHDIIDRDACARATHYTCLRWICEKDFQHQHGDLFRCKICTNILCICTAGSTNMCQPCSDKYFLGLK